MLQPWRQLGTVGCRSGGCPGPCHLPALVLLSLLTFSARSSSSSRWFSSSMASSAASRPRTPALGGSAGTAGAASATACGDGGLGGGSGLGLGLTGPSALAWPRSPFLQRGGLRLEVEELGQDGRVVPSTAQVGQSQRPATAPVSAMAGARQDSGLGSAIAHTPSPGLGGEWPHGRQEGVEVEGVEVEGSPGEETCKWGEGGGGPMAL